MKEIVVKTKGKQKRNWAKAKEDNEEVGVFQAAHQRISRSMHLWGVVSVMRGEGEVMKPSPCCFLNVYLQIDASVSETFYAWGQMIFVKTLYAGKQKKRSARFSDVSMLLRHCGDYASTCRFQCSCVFAFCNNLSKTQTSKLQQSRSNICLFGKKNPWKV